MFEASEAIQNARKSGWRKGLQADSFAIPGCCFVAILESACCKAIVEFSGSYDLHCFAAGDSRPALPQILSAAVLLGIAQTQCQTSSIFKRETTSDENQKSFRLLDVRESEL
jgi:hypothetical protein